MKYLLDTHIFIAWSRGTLADQYPNQFRILAAKGTFLYLSVSSIWEIAIKVRIGKLDAGIEPALIKTFCQNAGIAILDIIAEHATDRSFDEPLTRDPFDRMLLAQCRVEGMKLVTVDRLLTNHPLAALA